MASWSSLAEPWRRLFRLVGSYTPEMNFITIHYIGIITVWMISSLLFYGAADPALSTTWINAFFMGISAMSGAGMAVMNLSSLNTFQQWILWVDIMVGSPIFVSIIVIMLRKRAFKKMFRLEIGKKGRIEAQMDIDPVSSQDSAAIGASFAQTTVEESPTGVPLDEQREQSPYTGQKFPPLTAAEKFRMGGREYQALVFLSWVVPIYFVVWQVLGSVSMGAVINYHYKYAADANALNPWWVGAFNCVSAFNNSGLSLLDANMVVFNQSVFIMLSMALFILAGNTAFPILLRCFVWTCYRCLPQSWSDSKATLKFLLDYPRRCYTNMLPSQHTWWLFSVLVTFTTFETTMYALLNIGNKAVTDTFTAGLEVVAGLFQATSSRHGGFDVLGISSLRISMQALFIIMMYIAPYPVAIAIRTSNVYEERSLGIYADDPKYESYKASRKESTIFSRFKHRFQSQLPTHARRWFFCQEQIKTLLGHDIWVVVVGSWLIIAIEVSQFERDPVHYSVFNIIFEVVSSYGLCGLTIGLPDQAYSYSGSFHVASKVVLAFVMLLGRHRGLPFALDMAVLLPGRSTAQIEEEDSRIHAELNRLDNEKGL